jgi:hypothetical protein
MNFGGSSNYEALLTGYSVIESLMGFISVFIVMRYLKEEASI